MRSAVARRGSGLLTGPLALTLGLAATVATGCNATERVDLTFRPAAGDHLAYEIDVESTVVTELAGPPRASTEALELRTDHRVVRVGDDGALELEITAGVATEPGRSFDVRLDPGRDLAVVERVEGLPLELLGDLGPSRLVVLANGLLPDRPVRPGATWTVEQLLALPETETTLTGTGRLASLEVVDGTGLAHVVARTAIPVDRVVDLDVGRVELSGTEVTTARLVYRLRDGVLQRAAATTSGVFEVVVDPPPGRDVEAVRGSLEVRVAATTRRVPA